MAVELETFQKFVRIGKQASLAVPNAFSGSDVNGTDGNAWVWLPVMAGGLTGRGSRRKEALATEHGSQGPLFVVRRERNNQPGNLQFPLNPQTLKFMLDVALASGTGQKVNPYTIEQWFNAPDLGGSGRGSKRVGCLAQSIAFTIDRKASQTIVGSIPYFLNEDIELTGTIPTFVRAPLDPYDSLYALIDMVQIGSAFNGQHADVRSVNLQINRATSISDFRAHPNSGTKDGIWTKWRNGLPTITLTVRLVITTSAYLDYLRSQVDTDWKMRIGFWHAASNFSTSTTSTLTAGQTPDSKQTIAVADTTGLADGDIVVIQNADQSKFNVCTVSEKASTSFKVLNQEVLQTMGADTYYIRNCGMQISIPRIELDDVSDPTDDEGTQVVDLTFIPRLEIGATTLWTHLAANDDNA